jgi:glycosyltransferase involved in cell wall biosynthesis
MRIAVYHNLPSGGGKRALYEMVRGLCSRHTIDVFSLSCAEHDFCDLRPLANSHTVFPFKRSSLFGSPFGRINQLIRTFDMLRVRELQRQIARQIDAARYDLVFVNNCLFGQSPALLSFLRTPALHYSNEPPRLLYEPKIKRPYYRESPLRKIGNAVDPLPGLYARVYKAIDRKNIRSATRILTNSAFTRENIYRTYNVSAQVLYLGVDSDHFRPLSISKKGYVLSVGATHPGKGYDFLIQSLALISETVRPGLMIITNYIEPEEHQFLSELAAKSGVSIEFREMVSDSELVDAYNQALLTIYAPVMEPFGFTPLESMACGTAVVGVAEGGVRESIQDGVTGILTDRNPRKFANAISLLLSDRNKRDEFGRRGRVCVTEQWSWHKTIENLESHFSEVIDEVH